MKLLSLIGFMGCGKSSVGRRLSQLLCCPFMDLDEVIVERAGKSIPEIFADDGEKAFRQMELETLRGIVGSHGHTHALSPDSTEVNATESNAKEKWVVLALGGGTVMTPECAEIVKEQTTCIYLRGAVETLIEHLEGQTDNRPLLNIQNCHFERAKRVEKSMALKSHIESLMAQRSATYEKTAHIIIDTDGKSIETIASEIISTL